MSEIISTLETKCQMLDDIISKLNIISCSETNIRKKTKIDSAIILLLRVRLTLLQLQTDAILSEFEDQINEEIILINNVIEDLSHF
jgi:hypothetical protein